MKLKKPIDDVSNWSQFAMSSAEPVSKEGLTPNWSQFATSPKAGDVTNCDYLPAPARRVS
jgi:hypothetical protein